MIRLLLLALLFVSSGWPQAWQTVRNYRGTGVPAASMCNTGADLGITYTDRSLSGATYVCRLNASKVFTWYTIFTASGTYQPLSAVLTTFAATSNAPTSTALAANPANCLAGNLPRGVSANGTGEGCAPVNLTSEVTGVLPAANVGIPAGAPGATGPIGPAGKSGNDGGPGEPGYSPNSLISGGRPVWTTGLTFHVGAASYYIANVQYSSPATDITLDAADGANDRIDVIVANASGAIDKVTGTPAAPPYATAPDPSSQIYLGQAYIAAKAATPSNITTDDVYHENTEWTTAKSGTPINLASTTNPHAGTKDIEATTAVTGNYAQFTAPAPFDPAIKNNLVFWIRSKATWASTRSVQFRWMLSNTVKGSIVVLNENAFGFVSSTTSAYQQIVIPMSLFAANGLSVDRLRVTVSGSGTGIGWYMDDIVLQSGLAAPVAPAGLTWCGAWVATTAYPVNCQVTYAYNSWIALAANTNSAPTDTNTNWVRATPAPVWDVALAVDHTVSGATTRLVAGAALTFGQVCYMGSDGKMEKGDADTIATAGVFAMVADASISENATGNFLLHGFARDDTWAWATLGSLLVLDTATPGGMVLIASAPSGANNAIQVVGTVVTADIVYFSPQLVIVEHQ